MNHCIRSDLPRIRFDFWRNAPADFAGLIRSAEFRCYDTLLPIAFLLLVLCSSAEANIGIVQIYRASHWMGVVALVVAVLVEGETLGRWLHPGARRKLRARSGVLGRHGSQSCLRRAGLRIP